jgi:hypothetical protein
MPSYLVESYLTDSPAAVADARERAQLTAELGADVRYVRTTFLPGDETVLHVFEAASAEAVARAARLAALEYERIVAAVERSPDSTTAQIADKRKGGSK